MPSLNSQWLQSLLDPFFMMKSAIYHYVRILILEIFEGNVPLSAAQWQKIRDSAFSFFWLQYSGEREKGKKIAPSKNTPSASAALIPQLLSQATGTVLEIGPGSGTCMQFLQGSQITQIYGAEPCIGLHRQLRSEASRYKMQDRYHVLNASANVGSLTHELIRKEEITSFEAGDTLFDTIICVRVLCSVPDPKETVSGLYGLLRPGGQMLICEHVSNPWRTSKGSIISRIFQGLYMLLGWAYFMGDCRLDQDTERILLGTADEDKGGAILTWRWKNSGLFFHACTVR
ncbi:hypothetical protein N7526_001630 [Penicillium atrosanguineum]|nr:hypothetical protein N7526_001630 [Penicillium atrosanguineum]